jgi:hypothetical protein
VLDPLSPRIQRTPSSRALPAIACRAIKFLCEPSHSRIGASEDTSVVQEGVSYHNAQPTTITVLAVMRAPQRNHTAILLHQPHSYPRGWLVERACLRAHCHVLLERSLLVVPHRTARGHVAARRFISLHCSGQCPPPLSAEQA